jgi:nucleolar protein 4
MPFNTTEQDLRAAFLPYGSIYSIQIPTDDKTTKKDDDVPTTAKNRKVRTKGFAFVWMSSKKDAERAIEGCNGITLRAGTAESTDDKRVAVERVIAVDWALSKERWEAEKAKIEEDAAMHESSESEDDNNCNSGAEENGDDDGDEGHLGLHGGEEEEEDNSNAGSEEDEEKDDEERVKPQLPQPEAGTTLFIRNIPFNATEDELRTL